MDHPRSVSIFQFKTLLHYIVNASQTHGSTRRTVKFMVLFVKTVTSLVRTAAAGHDGTDICPIELNK